MDGNKVLPIGGLVAVAIGVAAIVVVGLATVFVLAFKVSSAGAAIGAVASGAFGVIGSVVGAYLGVKMGQTKRAPSRTARHQRTQPRPPMLRTFPQTQRRPLVRTRATRWPPHVFVQRQHPDQSVRDCTTEPRSATPTAVPAPTPATADGSPVGER